MPPTLSCNVPQLSHPQNISMESGNSIGCPRNCPCLSSSNNNNTAQPYRSSNGPPPPGMRPNSFYNPNPNAFFANNRPSEYLLNNAAYQNQTQQQQYFQPKPNQSERQKSSIDFTTLTDLFGLPNWGDKWSFQQTFYEPPKPDTPPTCQIPVWFDPVWKNSPSELKGIGSSVLNCGGGVGTGQVTSLNIQLPKLKTVIMPVISSPCHRSHGHGNNSNNGNDTEFSNQGGGDGPASSSRSSDYFSDDFGKCNKDSSDTTNSSF